MLHKVKVTHEHHVRNIEILTFEVERAKETLNNYLKSISIEVTDKMYHGVEIQIDATIEHTKREHGPTHVYYDERKIHIEPLLHT